MSRPRIAVLASGGGSNFQALVDYFSGLGSHRGGDVVLVASDRETAGALQRAAAAGIPTATVATRRSPNGEEIGSLLEASGAELVVLAGYLQLVPPEVTRLFAGRMLNVHPGPIPEFGGPGMYGARVHRAVLAAGVMSSGPTVHFVDEQYDHGATIAHWPVPVLAGDDEHALARRVLRAEHLLFPRVVQAVTRGEVRLSADGRVSPPFMRGAADLPAFDPDLDDTALARQLDAARGACFPPPSLAS